jgi:hypothetical protein
LLQIYPRTSEARSGDLAAKDVDGRVKPGHDEKNKAEAGSPAFAAGVQKGCPDARRTRKSVGIRWFTPRISMIVIPYRDGSTKARRAVERRVFLRKLLGDRRFRAFAVRNDMILTGGAMMSPRASFCVLKV